MGMGLETTSILEKFAKVNRREKESVPDVTAVRRAWKGCTFKRARVAPPSRPRRLSKSVVLRDPLPTGGRFPGAPGGVP